MFKFRKRVPTSLVEIVGKKEFIKTYTNEAEVKAIEVAIQQAISTMGNPSLPHDAKKLIVSDLLKEFISVKVSKVCSEIVNYSDAVEVYLKASSHVTQLEYNNRVYFFKELLPALLQYTIKSNNPELNKLTPTVLHQVSQLIPMLPNRNIHQFKNINIVSLIQGIKKGMIIVPPHQLLNSNTANKLIKRIRALAFYGESTGLFNMPSNIGTIKIKSKGQREQRDYLTVDEIETIICTCHDEKLETLIQVSRYSGMRLSELEKCTIKEIEGVLCFDLKSSSTALKTQSSYRIIPVHSALFRYLDTFQKMVSDGIYFKHLARKVKKWIDDSLENTDKKSLYSLRHSFATELIHRGADSSVVSELLGHSHTSMTLARYAKGFSIQRLQEVIELL